MPGWPWLPWVVLVELGRYCRPLMLMSAGGRAQLVSMGALTRIIVCIYRFVRQLVSPRSNSSAWFAAEYADVEWLGP